MHGTSSFEEFVTPVLPVAGYELRFFSTGDKVDLTATLLTWAEMRERALALTSLLSADDQPLTEDGWYSLAQQRFNEIKRRLTHSSLLTEEDRYRLNKGYFKADPCPELRSYLEHHWELSK